MAFSGLQKTRLGLAAIARSLYGSFAGKQENAPVVIVGLATVAMIDARGQSKITMIDERGKSAELEITDSFSVQCRINSSGVSV